MPLPEMDLTKLNPNFPDVPEKHVVRIGLIQHIRDKFRNESRVILVEGADGQGKTTVLADFARTYNNRCFSYFVEKEPWSQQPDAFLRRLCAQILASLSEELSLDALSYEDLRRLFGRLIQKLEDVANQEREPFFFVIDGLEYIDPSSGTEPTLYSVLPPARRWLYLLGSKLPGAKPNLDYATVDIQPLTFSPHDAQAYLGDLLTEEQVNKVFQLSGGVPGYLSLVRSECKGVSSEIRAEIIDNLPGKFSQLLERQWTAHATHLTEGALRALALSIYAQEKLTLSELIETLHLSITANQLREQLERVSFVRVDENGYIQFAVGMWRKFVHDKLEHLRKDVIARRISYLAQGTPGAKSLVELARYHRATGNYAGLLPLVTPQNLAMVLDQQRDISSVRDLVRSVAELAYKQSSEEPDLPRLLGFVLQGGILNDIESELVPKAEVQAMVALEHYREATELAERMLLPEHRLELLVVVAKAMKIAGEVVPDELTKEIESLCYEIKPDNLWGRLANLVVELLDVNPNIALTLANRVLGKARDRSVDSALLHLAMNAQVDLEDKDFTGEDSFAMLQHMSDANLTRFKNLPWEQVLAEAKNIGNISAQLYMLRSWCQANLTNPDAWRVVELALELIQGHRTYQPSLRALCELAEPLSYSRVDVLDNLAQIFNDVVADGLSTPVEEKFHLQTLLILAKAHIDKDTAVINLIELYFDIDNLDDEVAKNISLVYALGAFVRIQIADTKPEDARIIDDIRCEVRDSVERLFSQSADHYRAARPILVPLTRVDPYLAFELAQKANAERRRTLLLLDVLNTYCRREPLLVDVQLIEDLISQVPNKNAKGEEIANPIRV